MSERPSPGKPGQRPGQRDTRPVIVRQAVPTALTFALIAVLAVVYAGVRHARVALESHAPGKAQSGPGGQTATRPAKDGTVAVRALKSTVTVPASWRHAEQQRPAGAVSRHAYGPAGARDEALFITRYRLARAPRTSGQMRQVRLEARSSLRATGAPASIHAVKGGRLADKRTWHYRYMVRTRTNTRLRVDVALVVDGRDLLQIACQSRPGTAGRAVRVGCSRARRTLRFGS